MDNVTTEKVSLKIADGAPMNLYLARPSDSPKHPGLLVLQEAYGERIFDVTDGLPAKVMCRSLRNFTTAQSRFRRKIRRHTIRDASHESDDRKRLDRRPACSLRLAHKQFAPSRYGELILHRRKSSSWRARAPAPSVNLILRGNVTRALLPRVADLHAPMLFFWGGLDEHIGAEQIRAVVDECKRAGKTYVNVEISDADHGFFCDARPSYNPEAATLSWNLVATNLQLHLGVRDERTRLR